MDYIKYYEDLGTKKIISKERSYSLIKKHIKRTNIVKITPNVIYTYIMSLKYKCEEYQIDCDIYKGIISMSILQIIDSIDIAVDKYFFYKKDYSNRMFFTLVNLNLKYNKILDKIVFINNCELKNTHNTLIEYTHNLFNKNTNLINYYKQMIFIEECKVENISNLLENLQNTEILDNNTLLAHKYNINDHNDIINNNNNNYNDNLEFESNYHIDYNINSYINKHLQLQDLKNKLNIETNNISNIIKKIIVRDLDNPDVNLFTFPRVKEIIDFIEIIKNENNI
jgi:hypothetical protein